MHVWIGTSVYVTWMPVFAPQSRIGDFDPPYLHHLTRDDHPKRRLDELLPGPWARAQATA